MNVGGLIFGLYNSPQVVLVGNFDAPRLVSLFFCLGGICGGQILEGL